MQQLPMFTLYGLIGCPHCAVAEQFLKARNIPFIAMFANDDPIIDAGIKAVTGKPESQFPVVLFRQSKEIVVGFKQEDYERLANSFYSLNSTGSPSIFAGQQ